MKLGSWFGDKNKSEDRVDKRSPERAVQALVEAAEAAAAGSIPQSTRLYEEAIGIYHSLGLRSNEADASLALARMLIINSSYGPAFIAFDAAIEIYRELSLTTELAAALRECGDAAAAYSEPERAMELLVESLQLSKGSGDNLSAASALEALGRASSSYDDITHAREYFEQSKELYGLEHRPASEAVCCIYLGAIAIHMGDFELARKLYLGSVDLYKSALAMQIEIGTVVEDASLVDALMELEEIPFTEKSEDHVLELLDAAITIYRVLAQGSAGGDTKQNAVISGQAGSGLRAQVSASLILAPIAYHQKLKDTVYALIDGSLRIARNLKDDGITAYILLQAATLAESNLDAIAAKRWFTDLANHAREGSVSGDYEATAEMGLAKISYENMEIDTAIAHCEAGLELFKSAKNVGQTARGLTLYGTLINARGHSETAVNLLQESVALCRRSEDPSGTAAALVALAKVSAAMGDTDHAIRCYEEAYTLEGVDDPTRLSCLQGYANLSVAMEDVDAAYDYTCQYLAMAASSGSYDVLGFTEALRRCAKIAAGWGDIETAVLLYSKAHAMSSTLDAGVTATDYQAEIDALRQELGEEDFIASWAEGPDMTLTEIAEEAESILESTEVDEDTEEDQV